MAREDTTKDEGKRIGYIREQTAEVTGGNPVFAATVVPADAAENVVVTSNVVWTFNREIATESVIAGNFLVIKADGTAVDGVISKNGAVVTFNPDASLSPATVYIAVATKNVRDLDGNTMAADMVINFTTAT
jgi:hypothetical protein